MSGLLSLHEAMNANLQTFPSLNPQHLELGVIEQKLGQRYYQSILYRGQTLRLQTPAVHLTSLTYDYYYSGVAILIPISNWVRQQFDILDDFVRDKAVVPDTLITNTDHMYKPLQSGKEIYLLLDDACTITRETNDDIIDLITPPLLEEGSYSFAIDFSHVYYGYHMHGYKYSLNYRIKHIHFKPDVVE